MIGYHNGAKQRHASVQELDLLRYLEWISCGIWCDLHVESDNSTLCA